MFGDDTEMWQTDAFRNVIQYEVLPDASNLAQVLNELFTFLDTANPAQVPTGFAGFKYVNGGIFEEKIDLPTLNSDFRAAILEACAVDWSGISPAIFGSMFQSVRDAETRRALGEHYTSEENILKTLNPLFLDELRAELEAALARDTTQKKVNALNKLWDRLGDIRFMDPACGCGNFIIVAYRELRAIELQVMEALYDLRDKHQLSLDARADLKVTLDHFYGIEIDEWPARIAETAMFLTDRQSDLKLTASLGWAPDRLPIQEQATIVVGNALRLEWASICPPTEDTIVAGNPPFLGPHSRSKEQLQDLQLVWGTKDLGRLDYVTAWHRKSEQYFESTKRGRFALVSTNSVSQGDQVARLFPSLFAAGWRLRFAHQTFAWTSEAVGAAAVHCVITGFDKAEPTPPLLYAYTQVRGEPIVSTASTINAYLVDGPNVIVTPRSTPLSPELNQVILGSMAKDGGHLTVEATDLATFRADPIAAKYLRPYIGSRELLHGEERWCLWLEGMDPQDRTRSPLLADRIAKVRAFRSGAKAESTNAFATIPHLFTQRAAQDTPFVCIPGVSSEARGYLPCARLSPEAIASHANYQVQDPDGLQFAILSSSMLITWLKTIGGRLKSDLRFAVRTVWNNFPLPPISHDLRTEIILAGQDVQQARGLQPAASLAQLYNPQGMSRELLDAHHRLDAAVDSAFGGSAFGTEEQRQAVLFAQYEMLAAPLFTSAPTTARKRAR